MSNTRSKKFLGRMGLIVGLSALLVGAPLAASAATYQVGAAGQSFNQTLYYNTPRDHAGGSGVTYNLSSHSGMCGSAFWIALRNSAGDSTNRNTWTSVGGTKAFTWHTGGLVIPQGRYYITARNDCAGMPGTNYTWNGTLNLR